VHRGHPPRQAPLQPLNVNGPINRIHIDLCGPFPRSEGKVYILTCVDAFTRYLTVAALPNKEAHTVAEALVRCTSCTLGLPRQILSDLGTEFQKRILTQALSLLRVNQLRTTSFRPSCNGRGERVHRTLHNLMAKLCNSAALSAFCPIILHCVLGNSRKLSSD
jgi:transposase InsO family protein